MDEVVQVALPGIMSDQNPALMAYKSQDSSFIQHKERDCQVNAYVPGGCRSPDSCASELEWGVNKAFYVVLTLGSTLALFAKVHVGTAGIGTLDLVMYRI